MTDISAVSAIAARPLAGRAKLAAWLPLAAAMGLAILVRLTQHLNADTSWLIVLGEKVLGGARPYVDFIETNPPASILLYLPCVWLSGIVGIAPEAVVTAFIFAGALGSLILCRRILQDANLVRGDEAPLLAALAAIVLLVMPFYVFAEREHIALIAILPMLCVFGARATGARTDWRMAMLSGIGGGIAVAIKFYFALPLAFAFLYVLLRRSWRQWPSVILSPENIAALLIAAAYGAVVALFFPAYSMNVLPIVLTLYLPAAAPWVVIAKTPACLMWLAGVAIAIFLSGRKIFDPLPAVLTLASFGFILAVVMQGKGWPYHSYPALGLILILDGWLLLTRRGDNLRIASLVAALGFLILLPLCGIWFSESNEPKGLAQAVARVAPSHPKIIAIADDMAVAHPLTRLVEGRWVGTVCSLWMTSYAHYLLRKTHPDAATVARIRRYAALDRDMLVHDIESKRPDVILIQDQAQHAWAFADPTVKAVLSDYRESRIVSGVEIWLRKPGA